MNPFAGVIGQPRATEALARAIAEDRLFPSLIFHGPPGVGKLTTAVALCRTLLCTATEDRPCGACTACRRIDDRALLHPDVRVVLPEKLSDFEKGEPASERSAGLDLQERQADATANPAWNILIGRIRQCLIAVQRPPSENRLSVLIIDQAHRMAAEPANALLKTLEEPPAHALIILSTTSYHALLPTIRSRCQAVPFASIPLLEITATLMERLGLPEEEASIRAGLSDGRLGAALEFDLDEHRRRRDDLLKLLEVTIGRGDPGLAVASAESLAKGQDNLDGDLRILMSLLRDTMILGATGTPEEGRAGETGRGPRLIHIDLAARLAGLAGQLGPLAPQAVEDLDTTLHAIRRRGHRQLLLENFFLGLLPRSSAPSRDRIT